MTEAIRQGDIPGVQLRCRRRMNEPSREALWLWLVEPARLQEWLADEVQIEGSGPDRLELRSRRKRDELVELAGTRSVTPPERWILDFRRRGENWRVATQVTFEVARRGPVTELSVLHQGFQHLSLSVCMPVWEQYRTRWASALERLERAISEARGEGPASG